MDAMGGIEFSGGLPIDDEWVNISVSIHGRKKRSGN